MKQIKRINIFLLTFLMVFTPMVHVDATQVTNLTESKNVVNVTDYGADHSGMHDSTQAIIDALEEIKSYGGETSKLVFEPGTYKITKENAQIREVHTSNTDSVRFPEKHIGFLIEDIENLTVDGQGAQLMFEGDMMALAIMQSENVRVENLSWDFQIPTTSELTVFDYDKDKKTVDYFVPSYFNYEIVGTDMIWQSEKDSNGEFYWTERNAHRNYGVQIKYPTEMMGRQYYSHQSPYEGVTDITELENGLLRFTYRDGSPIEPVKGMNYQLVSNAVRPTAGAFVFESKDVYFDNVQISYMHGFGFLVQMAENVYFNEIKMTTDIATGKNTSSYADGIHVSGAKGRIEITNSYFNNTHDDPINIHGTFLRAEEVIDSHTVRLNYIHQQQGGFQQYHPGDKVIFYSRDTLESKDEEKEYTVKSVEGPNKDSLKSMVVEFEEEIPSYLTETVGGQPKYVAENITYAPEVLIKNNDFKNIFTRMILVTSRSKVVIEDNRFDAPSMPTLFFSNDSDEWYESGPIRDLEIRNNTFKIRSLGRTWWKYSPAIYFHPVTKGGGFPDADNPIHKNILIEDNTFYLESDGALRAESVENLTFRNNKILRLKPEIELNLSMSDTMNPGTTQEVELEADGNTVEGLKSLPNGPENNSGSLANVLEFKNSTGVVVEGNTYDNGLKTNVLIEGMTAENYTINDPLTILERRENTTPDDPVGELIYISTNPEVASVDENGLITSHQAGKTEIYAYTVWNNTIVKSNVRELTVEEGNIRDSMKLDQYIYKYDSDQSNPLSLKQLNGKELDLDNFEFEYDDELIAIQNGEVEIFKTGISKVRIFNDEVETEIYIIANYTPENKRLNPDLAVEDQNQTFNADTHEISFDRQAGEDLWEDGSNNKLSNLIKISLENYDLNNFSAELTLEGLPKRAQFGQWDSSYFSLMKTNNGIVDRDNYVSVGKRAHSDGIGMVKEINGKGIERNNTLDLQLNDITTMTLVIEKINDEVTFYYKDDQGYKEIDRFDVSHLGESLTLAVVGWGDRQENKTLTVKDIKVVEGTHDKLEEADSLDILVDDVATPITSFDITDLKDNWYQIEAANKMNTNVFLEHEDGTINYYENDKFKIDTSGTYNVHVVNQTDNGTYSTVNNKLFEIETKGKEGIKINGKHITEDTVIDIPKDLEYLQYQKDNEKIKALDIRMVNEITVDGYHIQLNKIGSSQVEITDIKTSTGSLNIDQKDSFIRTDSAENMIELEIDTVGKVSKIIAETEDQDIQYELTEDNIIEVPVYNGVVSVRIRVFAEDEQTYDEHTVHIMRNHKLPLNEVEILLNNQIVDTKTIDFENKFTLEDLVVNAPTNTKTSIHEYGEENIIIRVEHEDKRTVEFFEFETMNLKEETDKETEEEAKRAAVRVDRMIYRLPNVRVLTVENAPLVEAARSAYEGLSDLAKTHVRYLSNLVVRENRLAALSPEGEELYDEVAVLAVQRKIYRLPSARNLTLADADQIKAVRADYEELNEASKAEFSAQYLKNLEVREAKLKLLE